MTYLYTVIGQVGLSTSMGRGRPTVCLTLEPGIRHETCRPFDGRHFCCPGKQPDSSHLPVLFDRFFRTSCSRNQDKCFVLKNIDGENFIILGYSHLFQRFPPFCTFLFISIESSQYAHAFSLTQKFRPLEEKK